MSRKGSTNSPSSTGERKWPAKAASSWETVIFFGVKFREGGSSTSIARPMRTETPPEVSTATRQSANSSTAPGMRRPKSPPMLVPEI